MRAKKLGFHLGLSPLLGFRLTQAVRPAHDLPDTPRQGYRIGLFRDGPNHWQVPVLAAAVSAEHLFDIFLQLLQPLGPVVDVVLETSHHTDSHSHQDLLREHVDLPVLMSHFCDFEDLLTNDGCTGIAALSRQDAREVQFDEHKLLIVYAQDLEPFERVLLQGNIPRDDDLPLITEGAHIHSTSPKYAEEFEILSFRLGFQPLMSTIKECGETE